MRDRISRRPPGIIHYIWAAIIHGPWRWMPWRALHFAVYRRNSLSTWPFRTHINRMNGLRRHAHIPDSPRMLYVAVLGVYTARLTLHNVTSALLLCKVVCMAYDENSLYERRRWLVSSWRLLANVRREILRSLRLIYIVRCMGSDVV